MTETAPRTPQSRLRQLALALGIFALSTVLAFATRDRKNDHRLASDEPEWIAISILHWQQFVEGAPPAGAEIEPGLRSPNVWAQGVQRTTFGYMNPCLPKLVWGGLLVAAGHDRASPYVFQIFQEDAPERRRAAQAELMPAEPLARRVVLVLSALCATLLFFCARALVGGRAGAIGGAAAIACWFASPLVQATESYLRTDMFMLPLCLAGLLVALQRARATLGWGLLLGLCCGLAVSSKLNGGLLCVATALWAGVAVLREPTQWKRALVSLLVAAALTLALFYALNPRLWGEPLEGVRDILARWDKLMAYFQDELAPRTGVAVARTLPERLTLFARTFGGGSFFADYIGLGFALLGLGWASVRAWGGCRHARTLLVFVAVFVTGTILWLPLDWERFYLTATPAIMLLEAAPLAYAAERLKRKPASA